MRIQRRRESIRECNKSRSGPKEKKIKEREKQDSFFAQYSCYRCCLARHVIMVFAHRAFHLRDVSKRKTHTHTHTHTQREREREEEPQIAHALSERCSETTMRSR